MNRKNTLIIVAGIILTIAILVVGTGFAKAPRQMKGDARGGERRENIERMKDKLELTDDQIEQIRDIRYDNEVASIDRRAELEKARLEMEMLMTDDAFDRNKIYKQAEKVAEIQKDMQLSKVSAKLDFMDILSDEQREKLGELHADLGSRKGAMGGGMNHPENCPHHEGEGPGK